MVRTGKTTPFFCCRHHLFEGHRGGLIIGNEKADVLRDTPADFALMAKANPIAGVAAGFRKQGFKQFVFHWRRFIRLCFDYRGFFIYVKGVSSVERPFS